MGADGRAGLGGGRDGDARGRGGLRHPGGGLHERRPGAFGDDLGDGGRTGRDGGERAGRGRADDRGHGARGPDAERLDIGHSDADGLDNADFAYQWIRGGADIPGATGATYTAAEADEGERLKVRVAFEDDAGHAESLTSAATAAVAARADEAPESNTDKTGSTTESETEPESETETDTESESGSESESESESELESESGSESETESETESKPETPTVDVSDARVREGPGATLDFAVTLSGASSDTVTVDYRTVDANAKAGEDYTAKSGTLTFRPGQTSKTIRVTVLDDAHDEGEEKMVVVLYRASGATRDDYLGLGTIENSDPMPRALLGRFGRTAALHVVEHVEERIEARREAGFQARFAGRPLRPGLARDLAVEFLGQLGGLARADGNRAGARGPIAVSPLDGAVSIGAPTGAADEWAGGAAPIGRLPGTDDGVNPLGGFAAGLGGGHLLTGSAFELNRETRRGGILSFWSRGAQSRFAGRQGRLSLDGRVSTAMAGADYAQGPLAAGLSLSHSRGRGGYSGVAAGEAASSVTGLYPWLGYKATDRITVWGVAGYGRGALTLTPGAGAALRSGLSMAMAAGGMRGELADSVVGGFGLAFKADALWVGTSIEGVDGPDGRLAASAAAVTRYRTALEASRGYRFQRGLSLRPSLEVGLRRDGGDAETGAGVDIGGGLVVSDALTGLSADVRVRMLLAHQDEGFSERGLSIAFGFDPTPETPLGFVARVAPSWGGPASGGAEALWGQETMAAMPHGSMASGHRLEAELGYGLPLGRRLVGTPRFGVGTSGHGRDYRMGYGLTLSESGAMSFELAVDAHRRESTAQAGAEHGVQGRLAARW